MGPFGLHFISLKTKSWEFTPMVLCISGGTKVMPHQQEAPMRSLALRFLLLSSTSCPDSVSSPKALFYHLKFHLILQMLMWWNTHCISITYTFTKTYACTHICMHAYTHIYAHTCTHAHEHYVHTCICTHTDTSESHLVELPVRQWSQDIPEFFFFPEIYFLAFSDCGPLTRNRNITIQLARKASFPMPLQTQSPAALGMQLTALTFDTYCRVSGCVLRLENHWTSLLGARWAGLSS